MKLPDSTKKQKTRAILNTMKIMSLNKREMKFQDIRLGKIGDHIRTNRRIKLRENRRNIELFTNKQNIVATFIHVGNDQGPLETL
jgi:DNA-directed RNA polymerase delta subunit